MFISTVFAASNSGIVAATNTFRYQVGKSGFAENAYLDACSSAFARTLSATRIFSHDQPGQSYGQRMARYGLGDCAENIEMNPNTDDKAIVQDWINSPGHRENMEGDYNYVGIGISGNYFVALYCKSAPGGGSITALPSSFNQATNLFKSAGLSSPVQPAPKAPAKTITASAAPPKPAPPAASSKPIPSVTPPKPVYTPSSPPKPVYTQVVAPITAPKYVSPTESKYNSRPLPQHTETTPAQYSSSSSFPLMLWTLFIAFH
eukprot:NODE_547_length_6185_cov_0.654124.p4 type:complete len:261 gc:universal NODE_547_length_6185_cov_0.654124:356-1138(+)